MDKIVEELKIGLEVRLCWLFKVVWHVTLPPLSFLYLLTQQIPEFYQLLKLYSFVPISNPIHHLGALDQADHVDRGVFVQSLRAKWILIKAFCIVILLDNGQIIFTEFLAGRCLNKILNVTDQVNRELHNLIKMLGLQERHDIESDEL